MISVEIIIPTMISTVCALRRGMLRSAILSITRLRNPINPITASDGTNTANSAYIIHCILMPKRSSIRPILDS